MAATSLDSRVPTAERVPTSPALPQQAVCPRCGGRMWDERPAKLTGKRSPKAPDFKCRDRRCDGVLWPEQHSVAMAISKGFSRDDAPTRADQSADLSTVVSNAVAPGERAVPLAHSRLRRQYDELTQYVLTGVRPRYLEADVPCDGATVAAIVATLFIATSRARGE